MHKHTSFTSPRLAIELCYWRYFTVAKKPSRVEKQRRVQVVYEMLATFKSYRDIIRELTAEYGVSERTAQNYIYAARDLINKDWELDRREWVTQTLTRLDKIAEQSVACKQHSNAIGAVNLQARLLQVVKPNN